MSDQNGKMQTGMGAKLNRRDFLRSASALAGLGLLAACAPASQPAGDSGADAASAERQTVRYLSWWFEEGNRGDTWNMQSHADGGIVRSAAANTARDGRGKSLTYRHSVLAQV